MKKKSTEQFIEDAIKVHGEMYSYDLVEYEGNKTKVRIICPIHGVFDQTPSNHLKGSGCIKCSTIKTHNNQRKTTEQFITDAIKVHGERYNYSSVEYKTSRTKVNIICPIHGVFEQIPNGHLNGKGCHECTGNVKPSIEEFIANAWRKHGNRYNYSFVDYKNALTKVKIVCSKHGIFEQLPSSHLQGYGCNQCGNVLISSKLAKSTEKFIEESRKVHGEMYSYDLVEYITARLKVKIVCSKHGIFEQQPASHLQGCGCPKCYKETTSSKAEIELQQLVTQYHSDIIENDRAQIISPHTGNMLELDIWIPSLGKAIEFNGTYWHSHPNAIRNDKIKKQQCIDKGIKLLVIHESDWVEDKQQCIDKVLTFIER